MTCFDLTTTMIALLGGDLTQDPPVCSVQTLVEMSAADFAAYVAGCAAADPNHEAWRALADRRVSHMAGRILGQLHQSIQALASERKTVMGVGEYKRWRVEHVAPHLERIGLLRSHLQSAASLRRAWSRGEFDPNEKLDVESVFDLTDDDLVQYVGSHLDDDRDGPVWEALLGRRNISRTRRALGGMIQKWMRWRQQKEASVAAGELDKEGLNVWLQRHYRPQLETLNVWFAATKDVARDRHERAEAERRVIAERIQLPDGTEPNLFDRHNNRYFLQRLVWAIHWHRRDALDANLSPSAHDLKLWRQILQTISYAGEPTTLEELFATPKFGDVDWPSDFVPSPAVEDADRRDDE